MAPRNTAITPRQKIKIGGTRVFSVGLAFGLCMPLVHPVILATLCQTQLGRLRQAVLAQSSASGLKPKAGRCLGHCNNDNEEQFCSGSVSTRA